MSARFLACLMNGKEIIHVMYSVPRVGENFFQNDVHFLVSTADSSAPQTVASTWTLLCVWLGQYSTWSQGVVNFRGSDFFYWKSVKQNARAQARGEW